MEPHVNRYDLTELERPIPANVDIVFVHGLNGDPHDTWTSQKSKTFWPKQLLPPLLQEEKARILVYGYDADVTSFTGDGVSRDKIHNHAENLVAVLVANRRVGQPYLCFVIGFIHIRSPWTRLMVEQMRKMTERPIVFIAHSLGGLVVKRVSILIRHYNGIAMADILLYLGFDLLSRSQGPQDRPFARCLRLHSWSLVPRHPPPWG